MNSNNQTPGTNFQNGNTISLNQTPGSPNMSFQIRNYETEQNNILSTCKYSENNIRAVNKLVLQNKDGLDMKTRDWLQQTIENKEIGRKAKEALSEQESARQQLVNVIENRQQQFKKLDDQIKDLKIVHRARKEDFQKLNSSINSLKLKIAKRKEDLKILQTRHDSQRDLNLPELATFENALGFTLDSDKNQNLVMRFTKINEAKPNQVYFIKLDVTEREYQVIECEPMVEDLEFLVDNLNINRDLFGFIKILRKSFCNLPKN
ncbi:hypothetical protein CONCODRAFT_78261 [Conidiobolus coronatus NRRL 28638]|uniref:Kinetochore protein SPC25 n=1 Tax=Conidiobolus coronatus (strain ATCC 28846 / CBS 209.66 / NRRL 28638) TaxID=796925 RepID=A0A137P967_CONC2|nr:hypothetical protein CONCODRAFT_78261 [Conidiobolus coronatus NRRL 28638]|eukprot:KXN71558.1 hypothetical protein CONCODRAFT_78261 [Conidiobolus coronatus NRRL 28638]